MTRWFRHYAGMMRDEKLVAAAVKSRQPVERVVWIWGAILESASEIDDGGRYEIEAEEVAYFLRTDAADVVAVLEALSVTGRVAQGRVVKWGDRQYQSDKSAVRQARYRERRRGADSAGDVRARERDVTSPSPDRNVTSPDTDTDTDTDKQKEEPNGSSKKRGCRLPSDFKPDVGFALSLGMSISQAENEAIKFCEWWPAQPGQKGVKLDWGLTWQTWCRKALERMPRGSPAQNRPPSRPLTAAEILKHRREARQFEDDNPAPRTLDLIASR